MRRSFRLSVVLWLFAFFGVLIYSILHLAAFIKIFAGHSGIALTQAEALEAHEDAAPGRVQHVPKIIHQVFHNWKEPGNDKLPEDWEQVRKTCIDKNPGWEYKLWTEKVSREFIETEYPWFLKTYDGYSFPVQRVDAVRYFALLHYGGIYIDLDNGCKANLDPLTYYPMWVTDGARGALSNNILATRPHHPFWALVTQSLIPYNYRYFFPYFTISYASGQWFETAIFEKYHAMLPSPDENPAHEHRLYRLIMDNREGVEPWIFFTEARGGSWNSWDNYLFMMIGDHLIVFLLLVFTLIGVAGWLTVRLMRRYRNDGYGRLRSQSGTFPH